MFQPSPRAVLWRDRSILIFGLLLLTALSWWYMVAMAMDMGAVAPADDRGHHLTHARAATWGVAELGLVFVMWAVMMVAMMLPAASPMVFAFSTLARRRHIDRALTKTWIFLLGYLAVWSAYSLGATFLQWGLREAAVLSPMGVSTSPYLAGALLAAAGLYQFTSLKYACLDKCRSPLAFLVTEWRPGTRGAFEMGLEHGFNCAVCCWSLMLLMFVLGVMNLWWMLVLTVFFVLEKIGPAPKAFGRLTGGVLIGWGIAAVGLG